MKIMQFFLIIEINTRQKIRIIRNSYFFG